MEKLENQKVTKDKFLQTRVTALEEKLIKLNARNSGLTVSHYLRACAINRQIYQRLTQEEIEVYTMLAEYHNNFKWIANRFSHEDFSIKNYCIETANLIRNHLKKLQ